MHPRQSSRLQKGPKRKSSPGEDVTKDKVGEKRRRTKSVKTNKKRRDIIDLISSPRETDGVTEEDGAASVEIPDEGLDESNDDCASVSSSVCSGPSLHYPARLSHSRCSVCQKLYQKARKMKAPIKNKLLDNDPKSMTCDQWVLIKKRRPANCPDAEGKLLIYIELVKKRLRRKKGKQHEQSPACSRPHIYLKRNLRRSVHVPLKQERGTNKRRKRTRDYSQSPRVAKQQRLHSNVSSVDDSHHSPIQQNGVNGFEDGSDQESNSAGPSSVVNSATTEPSKKTPKMSQKGFRDLLIQLRGNSSMIVRETH